MNATGRSDFPNQVNNVLCFPFIFRGALDVGATGINEAMKHAAVDAIAQLARDPPSDAVAQGLDSAETQGFGPGSLIPSPFDPRLILRIAPAVARAAMESGVATRPIKNFDEYTALLERFAFRSGLVMKPVFAKAKTQPVRVIYAEGEDERVLRATQVVLEEKLARPILVGQEHDRAVAGEPRLGPCQVDAHEREQAEHLRLVRHEPREERRQPLGVAREVALAEGGS